MKENDKDKEIEGDREQQEHKQGVAKRASLAIFILVILMFFGVLCISYFFELKFGKTAGTIALVIVAAIIAIYLYRKEIIEKLKRK